MTASADWLACFPDLAALDPTSRRVLMASSRPVSLPAGATVFSEGDSCQAYLLVLDGSVRVQKVSESGREIVLYRVDAGQSCVLTTSCLLTGGDYCAEALVESDSRAIALSRAGFDELLATSAPFRKFVFSSYAVRLSELLMLIEEVAFGRIDVRLAQLLLARRGDEGMVHSTHHEIAAELGSAREVISRQLKDFERRGWVKLFRGRLEVTAPAALQSLSGGM